MRSIVSKVLIGSLGTFVLSLAAFWGISRFLEHRRPKGPDPFHRMVKRMEDDARRAYVEGGPERLKAELQRIDNYLPGQHFLTDEQGRDLVSGEDRSELLIPPRHGEGPPRLADGRLILMSMRRPGFERFRFIALVSPWYDPPDFLPYYGAIVLVIALIGCVLGLHLAIPLRTLRRVVDRFGSGELSARVHSKRKDEIGELSVAFDTMAGRIETLLAAERRLLQDVSHELRSPLARLDVAVELASTSDDPWSSLGRIKRDLRRLATLVDGLLQLTRAEGDTQALDLEEINLDEFLSVLVDDCSFESEARGCRLVLKPVDDVFLSADRELLRRAVENVIRNAIRHAPRESVIELTSTVETDLVRIQVRDFGEGVPDAALSDIFKAFFRVEGDRSRASGGVGLGLAIASRAIGLHHGSIRAENASPGLRVTMEIPLGKDFELGTEAIEMKSSQA